MAAWEQAQLSGGELWDLKGLVQDAEPRRKAVDLHRESVSTQATRISSGSPTRSRDVQTVERTPNASHSESRIPTRLLAGFIAGFSLC